MLQNFFDRESDENCLGLCTLQHDLISYKTATTIQYFDFSCKAHFSLLQSGKQSPLEIDIKSAKTACHF